MDEMTRDEVQEENEERDFLEAHAGEVEHLTRVAAKVAKTPRHVFSLRIAAEELDLLSDAAERRGVDVGKFIRDAALAAAASDLALPKQIENITASGVPLELWLARAIQDETRYESAFEEALAILRDEDTAERLLGADPLRERIIAVLRSTFWEKMGRSA